MAQQPAQAAQTVQPNLSFMTFVKRSDAVPKSSRSKLTDPLSLAKQKITEALATQEQFVELVLNKQPIPKKGDRDVTLWFSKQTDG